MTRVRPNGSHLEESLQIDPDDLDTCLVEQPGLFYHVADDVATANSRRDGLKLQLEETEAEIDQEIRTDALRLDFKMTEAMIKNKILTAPRVKELQRQLLEAKTNAERKQALKEAYGQRSFMLRELVAVQLAHFQNLQVERGISSHRNQLRDRNASDVERRLAEGRRERNERR